MFDAAGNWVPGPNDHHVTGALGDGGRLVLEPGLGKDEPSEQAARRAKANGQHRLEQLKAEVADATAELEKKEQSIAEREAKLAAREAAIAAAEKKSAQSSSK